MSEKNGTTWRRSELISGGTLIVVLGWVWWFAQRAKAWDVVTDAKMGNVALNDRVSTLETIHAEDYKNIMRKLNLIYDKEK